MDVAYNQHANQARRKNRSTTNLNHLTLAPLTVKLPLAEDADGFPDSLASPPVRSLSYLEGKSAPTTPALLTRSPARSQSRPRRSSVPHAAPLPKSKSATHLAASSSPSSSNGRRKPTTNRKSVSGTVSPATRRRAREDAAPPDRTDSDWMLRAGALISSETREFKGQSWLVSRASSTSLTGMRDADDEVTEWELARERELIISRGSRRGSLANNGAGGALEDHSARGSRQGSRSASRIGSRTQLFTPMDRQGEDGYFGARGVAGSGAEDDDDGRLDALPGPDFVNLDAKLEAIELDTSQEDEATVRRLVKRGNAGNSTWLGNMIGWSLFSVEETENEEDSDDGDDDTEGEADQVEEERRGSASRHFEGVSNAPEQRMPPPKPDEGGWQDAAWLLSVASKVLL